MGAGDIDFGQIHRHDEYFFPVHAGFGKNLTGGTRHEALAPELQTLSSNRLLQPNTVGDRDITAVGDSMAALDQVPGAVLVGAVLLFLLGMPADRRRIE